MLKRSYGLVALVLALLTPLASYGGVDVDALRAHCRSLAASGIDGVLVSGTTGEGPLLADDDVVAAVSAVAGETRVVAHVGRPSTAATVAGPYTPSIAPA